MRCNSCDYFFLLNAAKHAPAAIHNAPATAKGIGSAPVSGRREVVVGVGLAGASVDTGFSGSVVVSSEIDVDGVTLTEDEGTGVDDRTVVDGRCNSVVDDELVVGVSDELVLPATDVDDELFGIVDVDDELPGCDVVVDVDSVVDVLVVVVDVDVDVVSSCVVVVLTWVGQTSCDGSDSKGPRSCS
jgi:hypothetical protein